MLQLAYLNPEVPKTMEVFFLVSFVTGRGSRIPMKCLSPNLTLSSSRWTQTLLTLVHYPSYPCLCYSGLSCVLPRVATSEGFWQPYLYVVAGEGISTKPSSLLSKDICGPFHTREGSRQGFFIGIVNHIFLFSSLWGGSNRKEQCCSFLI